MLVLGVNCYFLVTGTIVIKDALIQLLVALFIYLLIALRQQLLPTKALLWRFAAVLLLITLVRHQLLLILMPGYFIICRPREQWRTITALCVGSLVLYAVVMSLPTLENYDHAFSIIYGTRVVHNEPTTYVFDKSRQHMLLP